MNQPVISRQSQSLSMSVGDRHQRAVGGGLSVGQLVDDVAGHDVPGEDMLPELVEDVHLLGIRVRYFENSV